MLVRHALTLNRFIHDLSWITIIAFLDSLDNELAVISAVIVIAHFFTDSHIFFYALFGNHIKSGEAPSLTTSSVVTSFARVVENSVGGYLAISCYLRGYLVEVPFIFRCKPSATVGRVKFQPSASCFVTNEVLRGF